MDSIERPLEESDLPEKLEEDYSNYNSNYFDRVWEKSSNGIPKIQLCITIFSDFITSNWYVQPAVDAALMARVIQAMKALVGVVDRGIRKWQRRRIPLWADFLVFCVLVEIFEHHHVIFVT